MSVKVDLIRDGLLGKDRNQYAYQYCNRRLVPARGSGGGGGGGGGGGRQRYLHSLSRAAELHTLLKQVPLTMIHCQGYRGACEYEN